MYKIGQATWKFLDMVVIFMMIFGSPMSALAQGTAPSVTSNKADYSPGELVTITGTYWVADTQVHLVVNDAIGQSWTHDVILNVVGGGFTDSFNLPATFISDYTVAATGVQSGQTATATFT